MNSLPVLETRRLRLRTLTADDVHSIFRIFSDPRVTRFWSTDPLPEAAVGFWKRIERAMREDTLYQWGLERLDAPGVIGTVTLSSIDHQHRRAELGFAIARA